MRVRASALRSSSLLQPVGASCGLVRRSGMRLFEVSELQNNIHGVIAVNSTNTGVEDFQGSSTSTSHVAAKKLQKVQPNYQV